jgi:FMN reductase
LPLVIVVGNPKPASRTLTVAAAAADAITRAAGLAAGRQTVDLCVLARHLLLPEPSPAVEDAIDQVTAADLVLVASPTLKGTYSGLLKVFFDRLPNRALDRAVAVPLMVMAGPQHARAVDAHLRPLLAELGAAVPAPGLAVLESDLGRLDAVLGPWAGQVARALEAFRPGSPGRPALPAAAHAASPVRLGSAV